MSMRQTVTDHNPRPKSETQVWTTMTLTLMVISQSLNILHRLLVSGQNVQRITPKRKPVCISDFNIIALHRHTLLALSLVKMAVDTLWLDLDLRCYYCHCLTVQISHY